MDVTFSSLVFVAALCNVSFCFLLDKKSRFIQIYRLGEHRQTRSIPISRLGTQAVDFLIRGAVEIPTRSHYYREFYKPRTLKTAIRDFRSVVKTDIKKGKTEVGDEVYEGLAGGKKVQLLFRDYRHNGNPIILVFDVQNKGMDNRLFKIVYTGSRT